MAIDRMRPTADRAGTLVNADDGGKVLLPKTLLARPDGSDFDPALIGGGSSGSGNLFVVKTEFTGASVGDNLVLTLTGTTESWYNLNTHAAVAGPVDPAKLESIVSIAADTSKASPVKVVAASAGNLSVQTAAIGTNWTAFADQACSALTIVNNSGTTIEVQQGGAGAGFPIFDKQGFTFIGITNANQLGVRRVDQSNAQVTVAARWEA